VTDTRTASTTITTAVSTVTGDSDENNMLAVDQLKLQLEALLIILNRIKSTTSTTKNAAVPFLPYTRYVACMESLLEVFKLSISHTACACSTALQQPYHWKLHCTLANCSTTLCV
jgi:hypothetical protein